MTEFELPRQTLTDSSRINSRFGGSTGAGRLSDGEGRTLGYGRPRCHFPRIGGRKLVSISMSPEG